MGISLPEDNKYWSTKYPIYSYYFNQDPYFPYENINSIPFTKVIERMNSTCKPLYFEYRDESKDVEFAKISGRFFERLFWLNNIWLGYWPQEGDPTLNGPFAIYYKIDKSKFSKDIPKTDGFFMNLVTKEMEYIPDFENQLVEFWWDGLEVNYRFNQWFAVCWKFEWSLRKLYEMEVLACKRVKATVLVDGGLSIQEEAKIKRDVLNDRCYSITTTEDKQTAKYEPQLLISMDEVNTFAQTIYNQFDRSCAELARVANLTSKEGRVSGLENWKDIHSVSCRQEGVLTSLNGSFAIVNKRWGKSINVVVVDTHLSDPEAKAVGAENPQKSALELQNINAT